MRLRLGGSHTRHGNIGRNAPRFLSDYNVLSAWRSRWDSNPRDALAPAGFQDRCLRPLGHGSAGLPARKCGAREGGLCAHRLRLRKPCPAARGRPGVWAAKARRLRSGDRIGSGVDGKIPRAVGASEVGPSFSTSGATGSRIRTFHFARAQVRGGVGEFRPDRRGGCRARASSGRPLRPRGRLVKRRLGSVGPSSAPRDGGLEGARCGWRGPRSRPSRHAIMRR